MSVDLLSLMRFKTKENLDVASLIHFEMNQSILKFQTEKMKTGNVVS